MGQGMDWKLLQLHLSINARGEILAPLKSMAKHQLEWGQDFTGPRIQPSFNVGGRLGQTDLKDALIDQ